jgi:hypothetical protein
MRLNTSTTKTTHTYWTWVWPANDSRWEAGVRRAGSWALREVIRPGADGRRVGRDLVTVAPLRALTTHPTQRCTDGAPRLIVVLLMSAFGTCYMMNP